MLIIFQLLGITLNQNICDKRKDFYFKVNTFTNFNSCMHILLNHMFSIKNICSTKFKTSNIEINIGCAHTWISKKIHLFNCFSLIHGSLLLIYKQRQKIGS